LLNCIQRHVQISLTVTMGTIGILFNLHCHTGQSVVQGKDFQRWLRN